MGTTISLVAEAEEGYKFVTWTGDVDSIADVGAPSTTVTMNSDYSIASAFSEVTGIWDWYGVHAVRYDLSGHYVLMNDLDSTTAGYTDIRADELLVGLFGLIRWRGMVLPIKQYWLTATELTQVIEHIELSWRPDFNQYFIDHMGFAAENLW